jgi:hypothetical protein
MAHLLSVLVPLAVFGWLLWVSGIGREASESELRSWHPDAYREKDKARRKAQLIKELEEIEKEEGSPAGDEVRG